MMAMMCCLRSNASADQIQGGKGVDSAWFDSVLDTQKDPIEMLHPDELYLI